MRAKLPRESGYVDRDGVKLFYEVYGDGPETMVFVPPWSIVHSRVYKAQLPCFSERYRCITYDARGNGKSDRPESVSAYSLDNLVADALAVMDATGVKHAIVVGLSLGGYVASVLAAYHPDRVRAAILIGTVATVGPGYPYLARSISAPSASGSRAGTSTTANIGCRTIPISPSTSFARCIPSRTRTSRSRTELRGPATPAARSWSRLSRPIISPSFDVGGAMYRKISCPMLVIHGDDDQLHPHARGKAVAELTGAEFVTIAGGGHNPLGRSPAKCNALILDFLDRRLGIQAPKWRTTSFARRAKRILYLSSPIGLGHAWRDIAVARELRTLHPGSRSIGSRSIR